MARAVEADAAGQAMRTVTTLMVAGAIWLIGEAQAAVDQATTPNLLGPGFVSAYRIIFSIAVLFLAFFLMGAIAESVLRSSPEIALKAAFVYLPVAVLGSIVLLSVVAAALAITDQLSTWMTGAAAGANLSPANFTRAQDACRAALDASTAASQGDQANLPLVVIMLAALLTIAGSALVWLELVLREAAIYVATLFIPLCAAGLLWPPAQRWLRRLLETIAGLVISKLLIVAVMVLGASVFQHAFDLPAGTQGPGRGTQALGAVLAGVAIFALAAYMPYKALRLIPAGVDGAVQHLEGISQRVARRAHGPSGGMAPNAGSYIGQLARAPEIAVPFWAVSAAARARRAVRGQDHGTGPASPPPPLPSPDPQPGTTGAAPAPGGPAMGTRPSRPSGSQP